LYDKNHADTSIDEFDSLLVNAFLYESFQVSQAVIIEVINSGRLSLIRNDSLIFLLTGWQGILETAKMEDLGTYNFLEDELFRYSLDHNSWRNTDKYDVVMKAYDQGESRLKPNNRSALESFEMENRIGQLLWYFENSRIQYMELEDQMDQIILTLEKELQRMQ
jgi:hypothetical protein